MQSSQGGDSLAFDVARRRPGTSPIILAGGGALGKLTRETRAAIAITEREKKKIRDGWRLSSVKLAAVRRKGLPVETRGILGFLLQRCSLERGAKREKWKLKVGR